MNITKKQSPRIYIWKGFLITFSCLGTFTLIWCMLDSQHNLPFNRMLILPLLLTMGLISVSLFLFKYLNPFLERFHKIIFPLFFLIYGILLFGISCYSRCVPLYDSGSVYENALYMAGLSDTVDWPYLARCSNNIIPTVYLSLWFRFGNLLHLKDVYYMAVLGNTLQVLSALYCIFHICQKVAHNRHIAGWIGMLLLSLYLPVISHTQSTYTDAFSFCFSIAAFYTWQKNTMHHRRFHIINLLVGILWGIGGSIKATVFIPLVALSLYFVIFKGFKYLLQNICIYVGCILTVLSLNAYASTLPCEPLKEVYGAPTITYFIGIGMEGDGRYTMESEFMNTLFSIEGYENRAAWAKEYILNNLDVFIDPEHMLSKMRYNFASGGFQASDFMRQTDSRTFLFECISNDGIYNYRFYMIFTTYFYMLLLLLILACIAQLFEKKTPNPEHFIPLVSMFGIMLYMMLCEANNRQLYNHLPWLICCSSISLWFIVDTLHNKIVSHKQHSTP